MALDLRDYTEAWLCNESSGNLVGYRGVQNLTASGAIGSVAGPFEDPVGTQLGRGLLEPAGGTTNSRWFNKTQATSDIFDIRGTTSCTFAGWYYIPAAETDDPTLFAIHNPSAANGQAILLQCRNGGVGVNDSPRMIMLDGLTPFSTRPVDPAADAAGCPTDAWVFLVGGWDANRNIVFSFWGRAAGDSYYNEAAGFSAGFGYGAANGTSGIGEWLASGTNGTNAQFRVGNCMWWNGRALTEDESVFLWNDHAGRRLDQLVDKKPSIVTFLLSSGRR